MWSIKISNYCVIGKKAHIVNSIHYLQNEHLQNNIYTYGIVDNDNKKNIENNNIICNTNRYTIENYLYDPVSILNNKEHKINQNEIYNMFNNIKDQLKKFIKNKIKNSNKNNKNLSKCINLLNGKCIIKKIKYCKKYDKKYNKYFNIPKIFIELNGHCLEEFFNSIGIYIKTPLNIIPLDLYNQINYINKIIKDHD